MTVRNPFIDTKLEYESDPVLWFSKRSEKISERGKSTFVNGTRGSGKTSILRSLSTRYICEIGSLNEQLASRRLNWFGVYLRLQDAFPDVLTSRHQDRGDVPTRENKQAQRFAIFAQYVELLLIAAICDDLVALRDARFLKFSAGSEYDALQKLFAEAPVLKAYAQNVPIETFRELSRLCRQTLQALFAAAVMSEGRLPGDAFLPSPPGDLIAKASTCLVGVIRGDRFGQGAKLRIKLLIDDCEVLPLEHQAYLNTLIRNTTAPVSWVIAYVGSLYDSRRTLRDNQMLSDADREIEALDEVSESEFKVLCQRIASLRLFRALSPPARNSAGIRKVEDCFDLRKRLGLADRVGVKRRKRREIARGNRGRSGASGEDAGKLGPEGRFQPEIFPGDDEARIGEHPAGLGQVVRERRRRLAMDQDGGLVLAHDEPVAGQLVQRVRQAFDLRSRAIARRDHLVLLALHHRAGGGLRQEGEGLRHDEAEPGV